MTVYLDHAATAFPKAPGTGEAMAAFLATTAGNPGRGGHRLAVAAARAVEAARQAVAEVLGSDPERTLLGPGATFWLNTVLRSWLGPGDRVVVSALEHNAVMRPLRVLEAERGVRIAVVEGAAADGVPTPAEVAAAVAAAPTRLVVMTHASNVTGAVLPVAAIAAAVAPVPLLLDAAQTAGAVPAVAASGAAAVVCSGHKALLGPPGVGVLALGAGVAVEPLVVGGTGSRSDSELMPTELPDRLEAGSANTVGIVGLGHACRWLGARGVATVRAHGDGLWRQLRDALAALPGVRLVGAEVERERVAILSFTVDGSDPGELARWLDREHAVLVRAGLHCAPAAHRRLGTFPGGAVRAAIGPFTTDDEVARAVAAVAEAAARVRAGGVR